MPARNSIRGRISRWLIVCTFVVCLSKLANGYVPPASSEEARVPHAAAKAPLAPVEQFGDMQ
jgi:hypothetical protein